ncbi:hypothetical protein ACFW9L_06780 [Streptomyces sp. NPDC059517]|uniref:hypothetical protein n=1 Tax=Streptomyces sp. NPDC059517 TaxID=3346855 RepID=UPI0036C17A52
MTRGAAGRRVLHVVLLVGGLFVLGLLCGGRAHAADGVVPAKKPAELVRSVTGSAERLAAGTPRKRTGGEQSPDPRSDPYSLSDPYADSHPDSVIRPVTEKVVRPVTEHVVQPVTELVVPPAAGHVVQPVGDLVDQITDGIVGGIADGIGGGVEQPDPPQWWPSVPQLPTLPGVPELPESPVLPMPAVPGQTLPAGSAAESQQPDDASDPQQADEKQSDGKQSSGESGGAEYGPRFAGGLAAAGDDARHQGHARSARNTQVTGAVRAPVRQVPDGDPAGALARHSAIDSGSPRHGDAQAVTLNERVRPALVPGAAADVTAAGPRDRHRAIPAFPG